MTDRIRTATVLLVDDQPANLVALEAALGGLDCCNLVAVESGEDALKYLLDHEAAAVLLDVHMPRLDGLETAALIRGRERSRNLPIIFVTAAEPVDGQLLRGYEYGVDYLIKPFDPIIVRSKVRTFVDLYLARECAKHAAVEAYRRVQAERERRRLYSLLMQAPGAVAVLTGPDHVLELANPLFCRMTNRSCESVVGHSARSVFPELSADHPLFAILDRVWQSGEPFRVDEFSLLLDHRNNGELAPAFFQLAVEPLRDEDDRVDGMICIATEITDQVAARRRLEEAHRAAELAGQERERALGEARAALAARDEFLSVAAHELRTPLMTIRLRTDMLRRRAQQCESDQATRPEAGHVDALSKQLDRLETLVTQLLDVSRIREGHLQLELATFDLLTLVREAVDRCRPLLEQAQCELRLCSDQAIIGHWDYSRLEQAVTNLISNAAKYGAGQPVEVQVGRMNGTAFVSVRDHGIGIPEADLHRIFERFERAAPKRHYGGLGLGLWITRSVVEAHGGRIVVDSEPGKGATFTIEVPIAVPIGLKAVAKPLSEPTTSQASANP